jgi:hypothetical protein
MYRYKRFGPRPRYGRGLGYGRGGGRGYGLGGRRFYSPNCDWYPDLPRGWWAMPEYQSRLKDMDFAPPPESARWDTYGVPKSPEAINYEISLVKKQIESLKEEIEYLESLRKPAK